MKRIFLDSSVLIAAVGSKSGASARILTYCRKQIIKGYVSKYVITESRRNLEKKFNEKHKQRFHTLILRSNIVVIDDFSVATEKPYREVISSKDSPILAAAHILKVDHLITHNTKDFMKQDVRNRIYPIQVLTPKKFVHLVEKQMSRKSRNVASWIGNKSIIYCHYEEQSDEVIS
ncbi:MAG: PIN domain-containing protein [Candidatus Roizmanbacteria bacterium]|nr:PIN domain-containing protein [Candidatus Roizmanbacteria bacterium]